MPCDLEHLRQALVLCTLVAAYGHSEFMQILRLCNSEVVEGKGGLGRESYLGKSYNGKTTTIQN